MPNSVLAHPFLNPPRDTVAQYPHIPVIIMGVFAITGLITGIIYTRRAKSPLFLWAAISGVTLYPFVVEPIGDWSVAVWYPTNLDIVATVFGRPMPWMAVLFYGAGIPIASVAAYHISTRGLPARHLLQLVAILTVLEVPFEVIGAQFGWMTYYGNHATLLSVPIYCYIQNGGLFAVIAWVLARLMPHIHGWRWIAVPFALAATLPVFALITTFPSYLAIATHAGPALSWTAAIISTILNTAVVLACIYSPTLRQLRHPAPHNTNPTQPAPAHAT
jgi:hypothetical protein